MSGLVKTEKICTSCSTQYIIVTSEENSKNITCCPFCQTPEEEVVIELEEE